VSGGAIVVQDLPRIDLGREELRDQVAVRLAVREFGDPFPLGDIQLTPTLRARPVELAVVTLTDDPDLLAELRRKLSLQRRPLAESPRVFQRAG